MIPTVLFLAMLVLVLSERKELYEGFKYQAILLAGKFTHSKVEYLKPPKHKNVVLPLVYLPAMITVSILYVLFSGIKLIRSH